MKQDSEKSAEPRPRGRPRAPEPRASVNTWLPASQHDQLIRLANHHGLSVSETVRRIVVFTLQK